MNKTVLAIALIFCFAFPVFADGEGHGGEGGGEESWVDRYFYHYEYIPYVNGSEFPRTVYRSIGTVGEQNIASTIGQSVFKIDRMKTSENLTGRTNKRDTVAYFDSRTVYRSDVFIFCDFAIQYEKSYVIEHYPYRDHHFHYYYYETPLSIVGFGYEASPEAGSQNLKRIYIDRDMLNAYVAEFSPALLVPASAVFGSKPKGARKTVREWSGGMNEFHTSYVWQLDYDQHSYGFWNFFDEDTLSAVTGATEAEKFFRNKDAIEKAQAGLKTRLGETPGQTVPDWTKLALDSKIAISPETLSGYNMPVQEVTRARDVFRMDASKLDRYFPSLREVLLIWQEPGRRMAEDVMSGKKTAEHYRADGDVIRPVWSGIPYDNALTSGTGSWIHWSPKDDSFTFQIFSDDASVLAHWLYGNATRTLVTKTQSSHPGTLSGNGLERKDFNRLVSGFSNLTMADLSIGSFQRSLYYSFANSASLLVSAIEDARVEKAKHVWTDSFVRNNPGSPWSLLKKHFADVYESIVPWTSLSLGLTFLDAGQSTAWKRGIQFELAPTSIFYGTSQETVVAPVKDLKEITGVPAAYEDDGSFTDKKVREIVSGWPVEMTFTNNSYDNTALIRYATARYYPVDLTYRVPLANALSGAIGIPVHVLGDEKLTVVMNHLFDAPTGAETAGSFGFGKWNKNAENMFKDAPEAWLNGWGMDNPRNIGFWKNMGKDSFYWNTGLDTWNYPRIDKR